MAKIKIKDLSKDVAISKEEMKKVIGGAYSGSPIMKMPLGVFGDAGTVEFHNTATQKDGFDDFTGDSTPDS